jgi:murein DD-endopeptidase MepM/ murein hydrolase activator NlpD
MSTYTVKSGDTLTKIAAANGTTVAVLMALNKISNANLIYAGRTLQIPDKSGTNTPAPTAGSGSTSTAGSGITDTMLKDLADAIAKVDAGLALLRKIDRNKLSAAQRIEYDALTSTGANLKLTGSNLLGVSNAATNWLRDAYAAVKGLLAKVGLGAVPVLAATTVVAFVAAVAGFAYLVNKLSDAYGLAVKEESYKRTLAETGDVQLAQQVADTLGQPPKGAGIFGDWDLTTGLKWGAGIFAGLLLLNNLTANNGPRQ